MTSKISPLRASVVTLGLAGAGALVGAVCGVVALAIVLGLAGEGGLFDPDIVAIGGAFGAVTGAIFAPVMSWLLLRHVPLGRAILHTAIGAILGGAIGFFLPVWRLGFAIVPGFLWGGLAGATAAAARLRLVSSRPATQLEAGDPSV